MTAARRTPAAGELRGSFSGRVVALEPLAAAHEPGLLEAAVDADMFAWMPVDMTSSTALKAWLQAALDASDADREVAFAIRDATTQRVLGSTRFLAIVTEHLRAEIGWTWVTRGSWGTGANVETKLLLLTHAFEDVGLRRVEFKTDACNERSRGALTALGATFEGIFRRHMVRPDGSARDSAYFAITDDEWPAVKAALEARLADVGSHP